MKRTGFLPIAVLFTIFNSCSINDEKLPVVVNAGQEVKLNPTDRVLTVPVQGYVEVQPGDTVYAISRRYGLVVREIIEENGLKAPYKLMSGQRLELPLPKAYSVTYGDTIYSISRRFNIDLRTIVSMNNLPPPYQLKIGKVLKIPSKYSVPSGLAGRKTAKIILNVRIPFENGPPLPRPRPNKVKKGLTSSSSVDNKNIAKKAKFLPIPPAREMSRFLWPVRGRIIANFGPRLGGLHNDGINIAAPHGAPILAAENGVVAYAGQGLRGFGKLLLIKHTEGWTTAYAHASNILVKRGEEVKRGQAIATVGRSGGVSRPQLHFEVRRGARAIDPKRYLGI